MWNSASPSFIALSIPVSPWEIDVFQGESDKIMLSVVALGRRKANPRENQNEREK